MAGSHVDVGALVCGCCRVGGAGFFQDHGRCGYVPKPQFMLAQEEQLLTFDADKVTTVQQRLTLTIISGHYLPKPNEAHKGEGWAAVAVWA